MSDITANVVVSMPSQLFTLADRFAPAADGEIWIGKIDTNPDDIDDPLNQVQVYIDPEDGGDLIPVSQPLSINAAGYPTYNGQIVKFVTVAGHSMLVKNAYGVQQFYFPNVLKYDPDQFKLILEQPDGSTHIGGSVFIVSTFADAKLCHPGLSRNIKTSGHTKSGIGSASYLPDGTTGTPSTGNEIKFFDADGKGWAIDVGPVAMVPIACFGVIPGDQTAEVIASNAANMKRGGELAFDNGMRITLSPGKTYSDDVTFSKPVGIMGFIAGLGANQTGTGAGFDGFSEWVHKGTGWGIYYEPWIRNNGSFCPDGIVLMDFGFRGNTSNGCLGGIKINDDSVIADETRAKRELVMTNITITGCWTGYGLKISWCFINNLTNVKIWDCAVCLLANRANSTHCYNLELEGAYQGATIIESADFSVIGFMAEYINNSRNYYTMPADYPVDSTWASGVNSYIGIGFRVRSGVVSFSFGYTEGIPVIWQNEFNSDVSITRVRSQILNTTNHVIRSHGGRSLVYTNNMIEGTIANATFYKTPSMPFLSYHKIVDNQYLTNSRPITNAALGFFGEFDVYRTTVSDAGVSALIQGKSATRNNIGGIADTGGYPVTIGGDVVSSGVAKLSTSTGAVSCIIGTNVVAAGCIVVNTVAGTTSVAVSVADVTKWSEGSELVVFINPAASGLTVTFSASQFKTSGGGDALAVGSMTAYHFKLIAGVFRQYNKTTTA